MQNNILGNYSTKSPVRLISSRALDMLYSYLFSHADLRINQTFGIDMRVLSTEHAEEKVRKTGFKLHHVGSSKKRASRSYLFSTPSGYKNQADVFKDMCLLVAIIIGNFLNYSLQGVLKLTHFKASQKLKMLPIKYGKLIETEIKKIYKNIPTFIRSYPSDLEPTIKMLAKYYNSQIVVFSEKQMSQIVFMFPIKFDCSRKPIFLLLSRRQHHVDVISDVVDYFKTKGVGFICVFCKKSTRHYTNRHFCKKQISCVCCNRIKANSDFYLNSCLRKLYCVDPDIPSRIICTKCNLEIKTTDCFDLHKDICKLGWKCLTCTRYLKTNGNFKNQTLLKENHVCYQQLCHYCFQIMETNHICELRLPKMPLNFDNLCFVSFCNKNSNQNTCLKCNNDMDLSRCQVHLDNSCPYGPNIVMAFKETVKKGHFLLHSFEDNDLLLPKELINQETWIRVDYMNCNFEDDINSSDRKGIFGRPVRPSKYDKCREKELNEKLQLPAMEKFIKWIFFKRSIYAKLYFYFRNPC
jgi:hypothetical protein